MIKCKMIFLFFWLTMIVGCATEPVRVSTGSPPPEKRLEPHLFSDSVYKEMSLAMETAAPKREQLQQIQNVLCNGNSPRVSLKRVFAYRPPDTAGLPIDEAHAWLKLHAAGARQFLKNEFYYYSGQTFSGISQPENMDQPIDADQLDAIDRKAYELRNFVNGPQLLQNTYAARFLKTLFFREGGYVDMQLLFQKFTFRVPLEVVNKFEKLNPTPNIKLPAANHYFGYDRETFSARFALEHQDFLWRWIARNSTSVAEAATDNGEIRFAVDMKLDFFCKYSVPVTDLRSH